MYLKINSESKAKISQDELNIQHQVHLNRKRRVCVMWLSVVAMVVLTVAAVMLLLLTTARARGEGELEADYFLGGTQSGDQLRALEPFHPNTQELEAQGTYILSEAGAGSAGGVLVCYYTASETLRPRDIHPQLCTHINVAFAQVENKQIKLDDNLRRTLSEIVKLKTVNPSLKILLSIGGAGDSDGFSTMIVDHASRKTFIRSIKYTLRYYNLDGIDLDWEFPGVHYGGSKGKRERQHFSQLLHEIRAEYIREKRSYLLTVAVAAQQSIVDAAYDVDQINLYADFVNVMTYDFHFFTKFTPFTGLNSPLYARSSEELFFATLNINFTVNMYLTKGLSKNKLVVGIPTYGHTFTLVNADNTGIGSPASGFGSLGSLGFVNFPDICNFIQNATNNVVIKEDTEAKVPYLYGGTEWVSYDNPQSVTEKAKFIRNNGLRGAMIYSLNADDYQGICREAVGNDVKFPLANAVKKLLNDTPIQDQFKALKRNENIMHSVAVIKRLHFIYRDAV